ncbi:MAG: OstA family protein [Chitinophagaceae bacterium]|nr:OstA family protein [Chitinophagaceae bacterium]
MKTSLFLYFCLFILTAVPSFIFAQAPADTTKKKEIHIVKAERLHFEERDTSGQFQSLAGDVVVRQENTTFTCDSAVINKKLNILEAFGHVHINDADSIHTYTDYLKYLGNEKKAYLNKNVRLTDGKGVLTTPELVYDLSTKIGTYFNGGKLVSGKTVLTSTEGSYYGETKDVYFKKKVVLNNPDYHVKTDTLLYNLNSDVTTFVTQTEIINGTTRILTSDGYFDHKNNKSYFAKRPVIRDGCTLLIADEVVNEGQSGFGEANGNAFFQDSCQGATLLSNNIKFNRNNNSVLATQKPIAILTQNKDSLFIAADTLFSGKLTDLISRKVSVITDSTYHLPDITKDSNANRYIEAYSHVKIYSDSMQAIGDSLFYSGRDSTFRLFKNPVIWAQENQITGDTIYLFTKNKKPGRIYVFENALAINRVSGEFYNQIKGRTLNGIFKNGDIELFRAKGNAESIYYGQDENNRFIGVNKANSDVINTFFVNRKPHRVSFLADVEGDSFPMGQVNHKDIRLKGFKVLDAERPKSKFDLFGN